MASSVLLFVALLLSPVQTSPPLTRDQYDKVRELVSSTQHTAERLQAELDRRQRELVQRYGAFELDAAAVEKLQREVLDLQRKLLANYHRMQVELRTIVGKERFQVLSQRINNVIGAPLAKPAPTKVERP